MKTSKFTDEQIALALRHAEAGTPVGEICRKLGVSEQSFYRWKKRFGVCPAPGLRAVDATTFRNPGATGALAVAATTAGNAG
jgi:putative transposase